MENNTAIIAGNSIYGGSLESNRSYMNLFTFPKYLLPVRIRLNETKFQTLFKVNNSHSASEVVSRPYKVCFCENRKPPGKTCATKTRMYHFRGEEFSISAVATGQYRGAAPAIVHTQLVATDTNGTLGPQQDVQKLGNNCGQLKYLITTTNATTVQLQLQVENNVASRYPPPSVTFLPCPFGFENYNSCCDSASHLRVPGVKCDISTQSIHRLPNMWIGNYFHNILMHMNCPFDYCKIEESNITLNSQDEQCSFNRTGVLCGACPQGLSVALGTTKVYSVPTCTSTC